MPTSIGNRPRLLASIIAAGLVALTAAPSSAALCDSLSLGSYDVLYFCPDSRRGEVQRLADHRAGIPGTALSWSPPRASRCAMGGARRHT
jgi:hypothetical protein